MLLQREALEENDANEPTTEVGFLLLIRTVRLNTEYILL